MPANSQEKCTNMQKFHEIAGYPGVIGTIDCTHVTIQSPDGDNTELYRNRKHFISINVQAVCNATLLFTYVVARWPWFTHDSTIFNSSNLKAQFEMRVIPEGVLLGDSGYACRPYLQTPLLNPVIPPPPFSNQHFPEIRCNVALIKTHNTMERAFGVVKRHFPCLSMKLRVKLVKVL
ncbi:hypothetical protein PR048_023503 [Dryococelus australis]|uniref:DDE Tnp4 domain-containing protein n=1 Tax=Dryococelus australis TaxID=614101 RepID=A0ABQ9GUA5_9NEOP|nr:hypothetical protein PR048_023503 [Dryococelus australis]